MSNLLKKVLIDEGINQSKFADVAGLSKETINRICQNKSDGSPVTRSKIIKALNFKSEKSRIVSEVFLDEIN